MAETHGNDETQIRTQIKDLQGRMNDVENELERAHYKLDRMEKRIDRLTEKIDKLNDKTDARQRFLPDISTADLTYAVIAFAVICALLK